MSAGACRRPPSDVGTGPRGEDVELLEEPLELGTLDDHEVRAAGSGRFGNGSHRGTSDGSGREPPAGAASVAFGCRRRSRRMRRRSRSESPPQIPNFSRCSIAYSRHSVRTGHAAHVARAVAIDSPRVGKNRSGSTPRHSARSRQSSTHTSSVGGVDPRPGHWRSGDPRWPAPTARGLSETAPAGVSRRRRRTLETRSRPVRNRSRRRARPRRTPRVATPRDPIGPRRGTRARWSGSRRRHRRWAPTRTT